MKFDNDKRPLRILCISPLFAPAFNAEAFCAAKMVQSLLDSGASVTVLTSSNLCAPGSDTSAVWDSLRNVASDVRQLSHSDMLRSVKAAIRFQTSNYARWVSAMVERAAQLHLEANFDLVYSRSLPWSAHIVGFWCAKRFKLPWIANINDPWASPFKPGDPAHRLSVSRYNPLFWLKRTLREADLITYPCEALHQFHRELARLDHPAEVIFHIGSSAKDGGQTDESEFRVVHAGNISGHTRRSLGTLLVGLKAFLQLCPEASLHTKLVIVGKQETANEDLARSLNLSSYVRHVGQVSYEQSLQYIAGSSVCVLVEAELGLGVYFPSKLADYIVARKPILAFSPSRGFVADLAGTGEVIRVGYDPSAACHALAMLYRDFTRGRLASHRPSERMADQFDGGCIARTFIALCKRTIAGRQSGAAGVFRTTDQDVRTEF
jgi:hypothetical protein